MEKITFAERLKEARKTAKLSQEALAKKVGRTKSTVSRWESGERNPQMLEIVELEKALGVSAHKLMYGTDEIKETTLSEINRISSQLDEARQQVVLATANVQLKEQNASKAKVIPMKKKKNVLTDEALQEAVDTAVAFDGIPLNEQEKEAAKALIRRFWEEDHPED